MRRRRRASRVPAAVALLLLAGLGGAGCYAWRTHPEWVQGLRLLPPPVVPSEMRPPSVLPAHREPTPVKTVTVNMYFMRVVDGEVRLTSVSRAVPAVAPARQALQELLSGPVPKDALRPLPAGTKLRGVRIKDHLATVDFSRELVSEFRGGSASEEAAVYAIVNTLTSLPGVEKVQILVEGRPRDTLGGHLDLSAPRGPSRSGGPR